MSSSEYVMIQSAGSDVSTTGVTEPTGEGLTEVT